MGIEGVSVSVLLPATLVSQFLILRRDFKWRLATLKPIFIFNLGRVSISNNLKQ